MSRRGRLLAAGGLPHQAAADALHIAAATCHGMDYLLTWNAAHIAKESMSRRHCLPRNVRARARTTSESKSLKRSRNAAL